MKFCTSAPFAAALKADVVARWPGGLVEFYGMTEGGGTCILAAHEHPTSCTPSASRPKGHDIRLIDEAGHELPPGATGEVVGHSAGMMTGYHGQPEKTRRGRVVRRRPASASSAPATSAASTTTASSPCSTAART